jgi:hypothetical protein
MASGNGDGFGDNPQGGFSAGASLDVYEAVYRLVMTAYGYRCALTGEQFTPDIGLVHPHLEVVAIRPRDAGGPLAIDNYLALEEHAARAFRAGHFIIEDDYRVVLPVAGALAPAIRPHTSGHLLVPDEPLFRPNPAHLAFHRRMVLGR